MTQDPEAEPRPTTAKKQYKYLWPKWWAEQGIDHPDVPIPRFSRLLGESPGPEEILRCAYGIEREMRRSQWL